MKLIDLLNKIANGEEVPKMIKWEDTIFAYSDYYKDYLEFPFSEEEYKGLFCMKDNILTQYLNDEFEIIEEDKEIKKLDINYIDNSLNGKKHCEYKIELLAERLNEIIDEINKLKENINV